MLSRNAIVTGLTAGTLATTALAVATLLLRPDPRDMVVTRTVSGPFSQSGGGAGSSVSTSVAGQPVSCAVGVAKWTGACAIAKPGQMVEASIASLPTLFGPKERVIHAVSDGRVVYAPTPQLVVEHWVSTSLWNALFLGTLFGFIVATFIGIAMSGKSKSGSEHAAP
jgi:hypothetical protein